MTEFDPFAIEAEKKEEDTMPSFDSFDTGSKESKEEMLLFGAFGSNTSASTSKQQDLAFTSFSSINTAQTTGFETDKQANSSSDITFDSFGNTQDDFPSFDSFESVPKSDGNEAQPSFPSFESFSLNSKEQDKKSEIPKNGPFSIESVNTTAFGNSKINNKEQVKKAQSDLLRMSSALAPVKSMLQPIEHVDFDFQYDPNKLKIDVSNHKPFKQTPLAKELASYVNTHLHHKYVFTND